MDYVTIHEEYKHKFFQIPKVLFTNEKYVGLSNNARVVWAILRDRASLSRKNNWYEKDTGRIYFIFTNDEMCEVTKIKSVNTITSIKKELVAANLIEQKYRPNRPSLLYLIYPIVEDTDISGIDGIESAEHPEKREQHQAELGITKNGVPIVGVPNIGNPESQKLGANDTDFSNTDFKNLDTKDTRDTENVDLSTVATIVSQSGSERAEVKAAYIERAFYENEERVPANIAKMLSVFSNSKEEASAFYRIITMAKKKAEKDIDQLIWFEEDPELEHEVINTFSRSIRKIEGDVHIENPQGYLYKSIYDLIVQVKRGNTALNTPIYNWLEECN